MEQQSQSAKEIRLFGEKSIREEAYRQKILQLEKEISRLESIAKDSQVPDQQNEAHSPHLEGLYHDSLLSFDKRVKREQDYLERRAAEIVERLNFQAHSLSTRIESSIRAKIRWLTFFVFAVPVCLIFLLFSIFFLTRLNLGDIGIASPFQKGRYAKQAEVFRERIPYIRKILQSQTIYHNQYDVKHLDIADGKFVGSIELNIEPADKWFLKNLCSSVAVLFQKYIQDIPAEFDFTYQGKLYCRTYLNGTYQKPRFQYFY
jgi:hypothetical protein